MTPAEIVRTCARLFPRSFPDEAAAATWLDTYQKTLGHLSEQQLADAWAACIASHDKVSPPLPAAILAKVPAKFTLRGVGIETRNMRLMSEFMKEEAPRLVTTWWQHNAEWFELALDLRPGIKRDFARGCFKSGLLRDAELLAQRIYWGQLPPDTMLEASSETVGNALGNPGPKGDQARGGGQ